MPPAASTEGLEVLEGEIISPPPRGKVAGSKLMTELDMLAVERAHRRGVESNPKAWYSHTSPDYDSVWYDEEAELRFRFSWSIVPRFNDEEVKRILGRELADLILADSTSSVPNTGCRDFVPKAFVPTRQWMPTVPVNVA